MKLTLFSLEMDSPAMQDIFSLRRKNLERQIQEFKTLREFSEAVGVDEAYISAVRNQDKNLGEILARRIENVRGLEHGWFDVNHDAWEMHDQDQRHLNLYYEGLIPTYKRAALQFLEMLYKESKKPDTRDSESNKP